MLTIFSCRLSSVCLSREHDFNHMMTEEDHNELSHVEIFSLVAATLSDLIKDDPLLSDLPEDVSLPEVKSQIAVEYGQSITLFLDRHPLDTIKLAVVNNCTVRELKSTIETQVARYIERQGKHTSHISWRYFWRKHWLTHNSIKLADDKKGIREFNIRNRDTLGFCKRLKQSHYSFPYNS